MDYNLKRVGWFNNFTDVKNQSVMEDLGEVLMKNAPSSSPSFSLPSRTMTTLARSGVGLLFISLFWSIFCLNFNSFYTCSISHSFPYPHLFAFCCSRRLHAVPLNVWVGRQHLQVCPPPHTWAWAKAHFSASCPTTGLVFALPPRKMAKAYINLLCA